MELIDGFNLNGLHKGKLVIKKYKYLFNEDGKFFPNIYIIHVYIFKLYMNHFKNIFDFKSIKYFY